MPRKMSAWADLCIHLAVMAILLLVILMYNKYVAAIGVVVWASLFAYGRERSRERKKEWDLYAACAAKHVGGVVRYAVESLPIGMIVLDGDSQIKWCNAEVERWFQERTVIGSRIDSLFSTLEPVADWGREGTFVLEQEERFFQVWHRPLALPDGAAMRALYLTDITDVELLRRDSSERRPVLSYIQIDNYDEVLQGLSEAQRTTIVIAVNKLLDQWCESHGAFLKKVADGLYIAVMDQQALNQIVREKFDILDKVRSIQEANKFPVTLSLGVGADGDTMMALGKEAQAGLDLALGRGGDQVAVHMGGKMQFYGGKAKAVEKHTRVKARVVAHALDEILRDSDLVMIMGHHNEDFDSLGAALGIAEMARYLKKEVYIVLSEMNDGIDKFTDLIRKDEPYKSLFIGAKEAAMLSAERPALIVVDTHISHLVAAPFLLKRIERKIVIDHHRRSESFIPDPLLVYLEPSSSSTSELVTELLMYFSEEFTLPMVSATGLYAGIVVDTKNFAVQTGVRTFDAAGYLRRAGADPVLVRQLFRSDYETSVAKARTLGSAEFFSGGLLVAVCPPDVNNAQILAAQVADSMLRIEDVRVSMVLFPLGRDTVGISARSTGEINVQVIMEAFGGGGHQNVAGAQVQNANLEEIKRRVIELSARHIEESGKK